MTQVNKDLYTGIAERIRAGRPLDLSYFTEDSSNEQISMLSYLIALGARITGTPQEYEDCIRTLADEKMKAAAVPPSDLTDEEFLAIMEQKRKNKKDTGV